MLDILQPYFRGEWTRYGESLRLCDPAATPPSVAEWLSHSTALERVLARHERALNGARVRKAVASDWLLRYFTALLPPLVVLSSFMKYSVPAGLEEISLTLDEQGAPLGFAVPHIGSRSAASDTAARYDALLWRHIHPLIIQFAARTGVPPDILWGNARRTLLTVFERALPLAGNSTALSAALAQDRQVLLDSPSWTNERPNPLFLRHRQVLPGSGDRAATHALTLHASCCLAYQLPHSSHCGACPLSARHRKAGEAREEREFFT